MARIQSPLALRKINWSFVGTVLSIATVAFALGAWSQRRNVELEQIKTELDQTKSQIASLSSSNELPRRASLDHPNKEINKHPSATDNEQTTGHAPEPMRKTSGNGIDRATSKPSAEGTNEAAVQTLRDLPPESTSGQTRDADHEPTTTPVVPTTTDQIGAEASPEGTYPPNTTDYRLTIKSLEIIKDCDPGIGKSRFSLAVFIDGKKAMMIPPTEATELDSGDTMKIMKHATVQRPLSGQPILRLEAEVIAMINKGRNTRSLGRETTSIDLDEAGYGKALSFHFWASKGCQATLWYQLAPTDQ